MEFTPDDDVIGQELEVRFTPDRSNMDIEFYDVPVIKPLEVNFGTHKLDFLPDNHYCVVYRDAPEYNRIEHTDEQGNVRTIYDNQSLIDWLIGFMLGEWETEVPRNRERQSMKDLCGWNSQVFVGLKPDAEEKDRYELAQAYDLYPAIGELSVQSVIERWQAEDEEDGS
jgi:hypothetical protein